MIRKSTWIILAAFVLVLAATLLWQRSVREKEANATPTVGPSAFLFDFGDANLTGLRIERVGDQVVELQRGEDQNWTALWPRQDLPVDSQALDGSLSQLAALSTLTKLDQAPSLAEMGLQPPVYRLLLTLSDGRQLLAAVGATTPTNSGYYVQAGNQGLYVINKFSLDPILELVDNLPLLQPTETTDPNAAPASETPALPDAQAVPSPVGTP